MKKWFVATTFIFLFILSACNNDINNELSGKTFDLAYPFPVKESANDPSKYHSFMKLVFSDGNKVSHLVHEQVEGTYELEENSLIITFENENEKLKMTFTDFKESENDFSTYTTSISDVKSDVKDPSKIEHLQLISNAIQLNRPFEFIEIKE